MYALGPASSAGALTQRRGGVSNLAGMRARVTRQRGPARPKPGLPGRGQARTVRPPAALRCPELAHKAAWNRLISGLATRAYSLGAAPRQESGYSLLRALADVSARMAAVLHGRRLVPGHEGGHPDQDVLRSMDHAASNRSGLAWALLPSCAGDQDLPHVHGDREPYPGLWAGARVTRQRRGTDLLCHVFGLWSSVLGQRETSAHVSGCDEHDRAGGKAAGGGGLVQLLLPPVRRRGGHVAARNEPVQTRGEQSPQERVVGVDP